MPLTDIESWTATPLDSLIATMSEEEKDKIELSFFLNEGILSPLDLYCYLRARFGMPNGLQMLFKNHGHADNLIHWHFTIAAGDEKLDIIGHTSRVEYCSLTGVPYTSEEWILLLNLIKTDFGRVGKEMSIFKKSLEQWTLFINPYHRLRTVIASNLAALGALGIDSLQPVGAVRNDESPDEFKQRLHYFINAHTRAAALTTMIRMAAPVLAEAFLNLLIFITVKDEVRNDDRIYKDFIQKHIDIRVKSLRLYCDGFMSGPDENAEQIKKFRSLMNRRNSVLHGNVDPNELAIGDVWFEHITPVFKEEKMFYERVTEHSLKHIEPEAAHNDVKVAEDFIFYLIDLLDDKAKNKVIQLKDHATPGWMKNGKRIGRLFPDHVVDMLPGPHLQRK